MTWKEKAQFQDTNGEEFALLQRELMYMSLEQIRKVFDTGDSAKLQYFFMGLIGPMLYYQMWSCISGDEKATKPFFNLSSETIDRLGSEREGTIEMSYYGFLIYIRWSCGIGMGSQILQINIDNRTL